MIRNLNIGCVLTYSYTLSVLLVDRARRPDGYVYVTVIR